MLRGRIRNEKYVLTKDYSGLAYGKITPTDIDGFLEFGNRLFVFIELKYAHTPLPYGQRLAYERLVSAITPPILAIALIGEHSAEPGDVIDAANCRLQSYFYKREWHHVQKNTTLKQAVDKMRKVAGLS